MSSKIETTEKKLLIQSWDDARKFMMAASEYTGIVVGKDATRGEYVISNGVIDPGWSCSGSLS